MYTTTGNDWFSIASKAARTAFERVVFAPHNVLEIAEPAVQQLAREAATIVLPSTILRDRVAQLPGAIDEGPVLQFGTDARIRRRAFDWIFSGVRVLKEAFERFWLECHHIGSLQGIKISDVVGIRYLSSDPHNNGRRVMLFELSNGHAIVYKPVNIGPLELLNDVIACLRLDVTACTLPMVRCFVARDTHGFTEYVQRAERLLPDPEIQQFYDGVGQLLAIAYSMLATDLHSENVMVHGALPAIVDAETLCYNFPPEFEPIDVTSTGMIGDKSSSAIQAGGAVPQWDPHALLGADGHLSMRYRRIGWMDAHRVYDFGEIAQPYHYVPAISRGFARCYREILHKRDEIQRIVTEHASSRSVRLRHLLRHTAYYTTLGAWLLQPGYVDAQPDVVGRRLRSDPPTAERLTPAILRAEEQDLNNGDIPYFWSELNSRDLFHGDTIVCKDYFRASSLDRCLVHLRTLSESDLGSQLRTIKRCLDPESPQPNQHVHE